MKHLKEFENLNNMIPGMMYITNNTNKTIGYINNNRGKMFPLTTIVFKQEDEMFDNIYLTEFTILSFLIPLNISIKDYIIKNNIITETLNLLKYYKHYNKLSIESKNLCYEFYENLLEDEDIQLIVNTNKYNL